MRDTELADDPSDTDLLRGTALLEFGDLIMVFLLPKRGGPPLLPEAPLAILGELDLPADLRPKWNSFM